LSVDINAVSTCGLLRVDKTIVDSEEFSALLAIEFALIHSEFTGGFKEAESVELGM
jgi:hypothetical protein